MPVIRSATVCGTCTCRALRHQGCKCAASPGALRACTRWYVTKASTTIKAAAGIENGEVQKLSAHSDSDADDDAEKEAHAAERALMETQKAAKQAIAKAKARVAAAKARAKDGGHRSGGGVISGGGDASGGSGAYAGASAQSTQRVHRYAHVHGH